MFDDLLYELSSEGEAFPNRRRQRRSKFFHPRINFSFESRVEFLERFRMAAEKMKLLLEQIGYRLQHNSGRSGALTTKQQLCTVTSSKFWSSISFQNLVRLSQILKFSLPDYAHVNKVSKYEKKMTINVTQHDDRLRYLRLFYNGAFSIASKNDLDDQNLLLATVCTALRWFESGSMGSIKQQYVSL
jgi:hypothetical protein